MNPTGTTLSPPSSDQAPDPATAQARVQFRQPVSAAGYVDAAWWPHTRSLEAELPALFAVLWTASRDIERVNFRLGDWDPAPRRIWIEGREVRLGGFATGEANAVRLSDSWGQERIDVVVIAPDTDPTVAQSIFDLATTADDPYRVSEILSRTVGEDGPPA